MAIMNKNMGEYLHISPQSDPCIPPTPHAWVNHPKYGAVSTEDRASYKTLTLPLGVSLPHKA